MEEKQWRKVTFYARMDEDDIRTMKECFYDAMANAVNITECCCLEIEGQEDL